jgi:hypothetical protein
MPSGLSDHPWKSSVSHLFFLSHLMLLGLSGRVPDQATLKFSKSAEDIEDHLTVCCGIDDALIDRSEAHLLAFQFLDNFDQVSQSVARAIQPPDEECVAFIQLFQAFGKSRPFSFRATIWSVNISSNNRFI